MHVMSDGIVLLKVSIFRLEIKTFLKLLFVNPGVGLLQKWF